MNVGIAGSSSYPFCRTPWPRVLRPVASVAREAQQIGLLTQADVKLTPRARSRSKLGVGTIPPLNHLAESWSIMKKMMSGRSLTGRCEDVMADAVLAVIEV